MGESATLRREILRQAQDRLVINPSASSGPSARVERRHLRAKRSHTSSKWLWIAKAKVRMYASSWRTGLRWLTPAASRHRPAPKGEGLRAIQSIRVWYPPRTGPGVKHRPKVTQNGHSERSNLTVALRHCRSREPPASAVGRDGPRSQCLG